MIVTFEGRHLAMNQAVFKSLSTDVRLTSIQLQTGDSRIAPESPNEVIMRDTAVINPTAGFRSNNYIMPSPRIHTL